MGLHRCMHVNGFTGGGSLVQLKELPVMFQSLIGRMEKRIIADFLLFDE